MCENLELIPDKSAIVYKIVAKKPKRKCYYSIAMGFKYPELAGKVPIVKAQRRLGYFVPDILNKRFPAYNHRMVGRTAGFVNKVHAECLATKIRQYNNSKHGASYEVIIVKAKLTDELMSGTYDGNPIVAGRHIEWLR